MGLDPKGFDRLQRERETQQQVTRLQQENAELRKALHEIDSHGMMHRLQEIASLQEQRDGMIARLAEIKGDDMRRPKLMEELENVAMGEPVFPGDTISHAGAKALAGAKLIKRDNNGDWVLSIRGRIIWFFWQDLPSEVRL